MPLPSSCIPSCGVIVYATFACVHAIFQRASACNFCLRACHLPAYECMQLLPACMPSSSVRVHATACMPSSSVRVHATFARVHAIFQRECACDLCLRACRVNLRSFHRPACMGVFHCAHAPVQCACTSSTARMPHSIMRAYMLSVQCLHEACDRVHDIFHGVRETFIACTPHCCVCVHGNIQCVCAVHANYVLCMPHVPLCMYTSVRVRAYMPFVCVRACMPRHTVSACMPMSVCTRTCVCVRASVCMCVRAAFDCA